MSETKDSLDLTSLEADYEILGEFGGQADSRTFKARRKDSSAKRRDDASGVMITIIRPPEGDEGNALSHMAADAKLLAASSHRRLVPIIEGRWLGDDAFALITEGTSDETLAQKLATRESFSNPRIAAILLEVNGLLGWAREHNIVHREVNANRIYLESKTDRVRVMFSVSSIPRVQNVDAATADARTIVRLAMAMLLGQDDPKIYETQCLADLRSDLPVRLCEASEELLDVKKSHTPDEVHSFISLIGMADPLFVGEEEANRLRADVHEEARVLRETIANEREEFERKMIDERAAFDALIAAEREKAAKEEADRQRVAAEERQRLADEKAELQRVVVAERAALVAKAAEMEKAIAAQRAEVERAAAEDRKKIEALRANMMHAAEAELEARRQNALDEMPSDTSALEQTDFHALPYVPPVIVPLEQLVFDNDSVLMREDEDVEEEAVKAKDEKKEVVEAGDAQKGVPAAVAKLPAATDEKSKKWKKWYIPGAFAAVVVLVGMSAMALNARGTRTKAPAAPTPVRVAAKPAQPAPTPAPAAAPLVPLPTIIVDSSSGMVVPLGPPRPRRPRPVVAEPVVSSDSVRDGIVLPDPGFTPRVRTDTVVARESAAPRDSVTRRDTVTIPDTVVRRDTVARRDSAARRDTVVKPDTVLVKPDTLVRPPVDPR